MDETKDTRRREAPDYEERCEIWGRIAAARRTCRECGGFGAFWWGTAKVAECTACRGTGRQ
jgi:DnaJ-class molecular chaperone